MERLRSTGGRAIKTTVEQTLMRGLVTAFPCVRPGLPRSASGHRRLCVGHTVGREGSPLRLCPQHCATADVIGERASSVLQGGESQTAGRGSISRPIAQRKAAISRAIAVVTTVWRLPAAINLR